MATLSEVIEDKYGSQMQLLLYFDFGYIEAATWYMKNHQRTYSKSDIKKILDQTINKHAKNQNDIHNNPVGWAVDYCFEAWWKDLPSPRSLEEQEEENKEHPANMGSYEDVVGRVQVKQAQVLMDEQMYGHNDDTEGMGSPFKGENTALTQRLLSSPEKIRLAWYNFKGITEGQLCDKLEELGVLDKSIRNRVMKYLLALCNHPSDVMTLLDNELPLSARTVAKWVIDHLNHEAIYMQDSSTWYYLQNNKYMSTPDCHKGNPINNILEDYYDLCSDYQHDYPLFSKTISTFTDKLQEHTKNLYYLIGNVETHTETEFNNNVLKEGRFCTPRGLYDYTHKINDSNGFTKVTTKAKICDMTDQEINTCRGVQLFSDFMQQIQPDQETRNYLVGVIANAITGHRENEYTYIFHGSTGANGKSVLTGLLQDMLGDYYADYNTDSLVRHSYGETAEQAAKNLENRRLVGGREIGDGSTIDGGAFKRYFSNDSYTINEKYKPSYSVMPTHTMFLSVNQMPNFGSDPAVRRRLVVIPFTEHFVNNPDPKNPHEHQLKPDTLKQLIAHEDDIFTYLVRYAEHLRKGDITLTVPNTIQHYGDEMIDETNVLADFIERECEVLTEEEINDPTIPTPKVTSAELYERYRESLPQGTYDPYKTQRAFVHALLLKYLQLYLKAARTTDRKVVQAIHGIWLNPATTAALKLAKSRTDDNGMPVSYSTFKANSDYQDWLNTHSEK